MPSSRSVAALASVVLLTLSALTACGGSDDDQASEEPRTSTSQGAGADDTADDTAAETADTDEGSGDGAGATGGFADCSAITAEEMAPVLGEGTGTSKVPPGGAGCNYALDDPRQPSVFIEQFATSDFADGFEGAKANISQTAVGPIEGAAETDVSDVGDGAKVTVGPGPLGGEALQSIGLVLVGDTIVRASVLQAVDLDQAALLELTTGVLTLVASKA